MTRGEGMEQFDRFVHAGYRQPEDAAAAFEEWYRAFSACDVEAVASAVTRLIRGRASSFWPTPGELREYLGAPPESGRRSRGCAVCQGSRWVEAVPYRANGALVYRGVVRCSACGVPAPVLDHLRGSQTPLSAAEYRAMVCESAVPVLTEAEYRARVSALVARLGMR